jgi:hypothetical protein
MEVLDLREPAASDEWEAVAKMATGPLLAPAALKDSVADADERGTLLLGP